MGKTKFVEGLEQLGYTVEDKGGNRVVVNLKIEEGRFQGREIKMGFEVPDDFEITPPSGPHIFPKLLPVLPDGPDHNTRATESPNFGTDWEYLSRPFPKWGKNRSVKRYMEYMKYLMNTL